MKSTSPVTPGSAPESIQLVQLASLHGSRHIGWLDHSGVFYPYLNDELA